MTIIIFGAIVLLGILLLYIYYRQRHHADAEPENDESKAYAIFTQALDQMGCQYTSHSPNNIEFPYQGFRMLCNYRAIDVLLAIPFIYELELDDFDNVAIAQEIANEVNCMKNVSIGYSINKEKGQLNESTQAITSQYTPPTRRRATIMAALHGIGR